LLVALGVALLVFVHGPVRWYPRSWYFLVLVPLALLVPLSVVALFRDGLPRRVAAALIGALFVMVVAVQSKQTYAGLRASPFPWQVEMYDAATSLDALVPSGAIVGSFNSGMMGFLSNRTIVNLDGVVNERAIRAMRARALADYLRGRNVSYLADYPSIWEDPQFGYGYLAFMGPQINRMQLESMAQFDTPGVGWPTPRDGVGVFRVAWRD
jgi:hypothetical protein